MKSTVDLVLRRTDEATIDNSPEGQWGLVVSTLLTEVKICQPGKVVALNV